jgi:hypothetical protein
MKVLLTEGTEEASAASILVIPQVPETTFETLSGKAQDRGIVAEAHYAAVMKAVNTAVWERAVPRITSEGLLKEAEWMARALDTYEVGSRILLGVTDRGWYFDASQAKRVDRAVGLAEGDVIAVGPSASREWLNARGRVVSIGPEQVHVELQAGDRERIERATCKKLPERTVFSRFLVEKVEGGR